MASSSYEYMSEPLIDKAFICKHCKHPLIDPVVLTSCDQTFCRTCIESNLENHSRACAKCNKKSWSVNDLTPADPALCRMLDHLLIKCPHCEQTNIQRIMFDEHVKKLCPKVIVACSASDIECPWTDPANQLEQHVTSCAYEQLRLILAGLITHNKYLKERCGQADRNCQTLQILNNSRSSYQQTCRHYLTLFIVIFSALLTIATVFYFITFIYSPRSVIVFIITLFIVLLGVAFHFRLINFYIVGFVFYSLFGLVREFSRSVVSCFHRARVAFDRLWVRIFINR